MLRCPNCNSHDLGKVGTNQYYCWHCFVELSVTGGRIEAVYQVEEDGSLSSLNDLFLDHPNQANL
ncbi:hypothetical protein CLV97_11218 [Planifilum fimeticola]|jgi:hypothetical protein|uniref:Uncharacterized protein n=1 Tax=Planifilum fimeticola TaxID=201975 RepID=A0A2T0LEK3_9BACL|nr:hypothetical protein [Planifilum fimeticola]PRX40541.1 hypothetical protein CLV97_11218 [Planifilum fimeticola]